MQSAECKVQSAKCKVQSAKCKVQSAKCRMQSAECREFKIQSRESHRAVEVEQSLNPFDRSVTVAALSAEWQGGRAVIVAAFQPYTTFEDNSIYALEIKFANEHEDQFFDSPSQISSNSTFYQIHYFIQFSVS